MIWRRIGILTLTALLQSDFALADDGMDKARIIMTAMHADQCTADPPPDDEWSDKAWDVTWRYQGQSAEEPDLRGRLLRLFCDSGAYNVLHAWFMESENGVSPLSFAMPAFDVERVSEDFDSAVTGIKATGFRAETMLVNSDYDAAAGEISMVSMWRGIGDAFSTGKWALTEGDPVLIFFEVDASYDGEQTPETIYKAE